MAETIARPQKIEPALDHQPDRSSQLSALPAEDNTPESLQAYLTANAEYRNRVWPSPYNSTYHKLNLGDARDLSWIDDETVHLVVTSPPYWTLKRYEQDCEGQLGDIEDYDVFLNELDKAWKECARTLVGGGRICCVVGDVCVSRRRGGRHYVMPLHADIQTRARKLGLDCLTPIIWHKIANGVTEAEGNGAGFYGKPYQPGAVVKNDVEYILFLRKGGTYRSASPTQKALSMLNREEMQSWLRSIWTDVRGASTRDGHPSPYPVGLAERLIRMFSFAGDTILDPFVGIGSTSLAAMRAGRHSIGNEIEPAYLRIAAAKLKSESLKERKAGPVNCQVETFELCNEL
jgi:DNA modification methylase